MKIKFTGKNGGDPGEYWRSIETAARIQVADAVKGGSYLIEKIRSLTARGVDYRGRPFAEYSEAYAKAKGDTHVNLSRSGRMLGALRVRVNGRIFSSTSTVATTERANGMQVGIFENDKEAMKGSVHNNGLLIRRSQGRKSVLRGSVTRIPQRRWLDATAATTNEIKQVMNNSREERVRDTI